MVVYIFAFDIAYELNLPAVKTLLDCPVEQFSVDVGKRSPRRLLFSWPQMVRLPAVDRTGPHGRVQVEPIVKLLPVGAISITMRVPFAVDHVEELVAYHDLCFASGPLHDEVLALAEQVRRELAPHCLRPVPQLADEEAYTVFSLEAPLRDPDGARMTTEGWLQTHRRQVAALLTQETDISHLSKQEANESTGRYLSYYENDLVVVDWDAALIIDDPEDFDGPLYVMELANLQLAELEAYDRILDDALERAYRDLGDRSARRRRAVLNELREIRIDLARMADELSNTTKFFGDWHLARLYENIAARFHLADWHRTIENKLRTLDNLYEMLQHAWSNQWMLILEAAIVVLFIIDLVVLVMTMK